MRETAWAEDHRKGAGASSLPLQSVPTFAVRDLNVIYGWDPSPQDFQVPAAEFGLPAALWEGDGILASRTRSGLFRPPPQSPVKDGSHSLCYPLPHDSTGE